jgi:VIT1/CCC1 family predicted Fe2+/Mn2+ transporter
VGVDMFILTAIIGMFAGVKAMAVQNYLAAKSQIEILQSEVKREEYKIENTLEEERKEIEEIYYKSKGFAGEELNMVINKITSNKGVWLKTMLTEELGLNLEILDNPLKGAIVMFISFLVCGIFSIYHIL